MVALKRKQESTNGSNGTNGTAHHKKSKIATSSFILNSYSKLPNINEQVPLKTTPLDIFVWGTGSMCELGLGPAASTKEVKRPRLNGYLTPEKLGKDTSIVDFAVGGMHTLVLDSQNRVWSWGGNDSGVLGRDTSKASVVLKSLDDVDSSDDEDGDLNEAESVPGLVEDLPKTDSKIVQLCATDNLSAVLYDNGDVYAWGCFRCNEGLLGFLRDEIKIQKTPLKIQEFKNIAQLAGGKDHILALDKKGIVYAWGNGQQFQLGRRIMERHRFRSLEPQQFGLYNIKYIASGDFHCFAIDHDDQVYAWGLNQFGQCAFTDADGNLEDGSLITKPTIITSLSNKKIVSIEAGEHNTLALTEGGDVYGWGRYDMKEVGIAKDQLPESTYKDEHGKVRSIPVPTKLQFGKKDSSEVNVKLLDVVPTTLLQ